MTVSELVSTWSDAVDAVVEELLDAVHVTAPPVDPLAMAERLRVSVALDAGQGTRGRTKRIGGQPAIFLKPDDRRERMFWAAAHELGELLIWRVAHVHGAGEDAIGPNDREDLANLFAARLLLPKTWFLSAAHEADGDLLALKPMFATASHEMIALRLMDLDLPTVITVFDHGQLTRRRSNVAGGTPPLQSVERRAQGDTHLLGIPSELRHGGLRTQAWPIHEPGWKREILRTTPVEDDSL
ncbi:MAG: ImmA/IrrE family metallo-endopeptidase [Planctomycetaceae bacterium]|nr:ImmA/IrrE family metallo-endopeptidase [Planctomycetaceae bacterium]